MQMSNTGSWQAENCMKGNHRRTYRQACPICGVIGNTYDTPTIVEAL